MYESDAPRHVLQVDDAPILSEGRYGGDQTLTVTTTGAAETGLRRLETDSFDAVVLADSPLDWPDFVERARAVDDDLPLVLVTDSRAAATDALSHGVTDVFRRDAESEQARLLAHRVRLLVDRHESASTADRTTRWLRELTDQSSELLWMFSGDWSDLLFVNSTYEELYGRSVERLRENPESFMTAVHPEDQQRIAEVMHAASTGESVTAEFRITHPEAGQRWVRAAATPVVDDGEVTRIIGVSRDVTAAKGAAQADTGVTDPERLLESLPDVVYALDDEGALVRWNDRLRAVTGYADDAIAAMPPAELFVPSDRETVRDAIETAVEDGEASFEAALQTADAAVAHEFRLSRFEQPEGADGALVGVGRDVSERQRRRAELERQNERLEAFASAVSHDLRSPLDVAQGQLALARMDHDSEHLEAVERAHHRIGRLVDDLLTLAREGEAAIELEAVPLQTVVEGCWQTVETGGATLALQTDAVVRANPGQLRQLFENLIANAVTHGQEGATVDGCGDAEEHGSTASLSQSRTGASAGVGSDLTITVGDMDTGFYVADDGVGIPADDRDRVFESGYSSAGRTGLGLPIVREIADTHGWGVTVTDSDAGGARFEVTGVAVE